MTHLPSMWAFLVFSEVVSLCHSSGDIISRCGNEHVLLSQISAHTELHYKTLLQNAAFKIAYMQIFRQFG